MSMPKKEHLIFPAMRVTQPIGDFFVASMDASKLADISFADVRRMEGTDGRREIERYLGVDRKNKRGFGAMAREVFA